MSEDERRVERFELERRVDRLLEQNTTEVQRRQEYQARLRSVRAALTAAEKAAFLQHIGAEGKIIRDPCMCSSCVTIRGIVAFLEKE